MFLYFKCMSLGIGFDKHYFLVDLDIIGGALPSGEGFSASRLGFITGFPNPGREISREMPFSWESLLVFDCFHF